MRKHIACYFVIPIFAFFCLAAVIPARAIEFTPPPFRDTSYAAKYVSQSISDPVSVEAGTVKEVVVKIKNTGTATWYSNGNNFVSAYTVNPNYHKSVFAGALWVGKDQPVKISGTTKPGQPAEIKIKLYAPAKTGDYKEYFYLAAENKTWIKSSYFYLKIKVVPAKSLANSQTAAGTADAVGNSGAGQQDEASLVNKEYQSNLLAFTARKIEATGGQQVHFIVRYLNNGTIAWKNYLWQEAGSLAVGDLNIASVSKISIADSSWLSVNKIKTETRAVAPGEPLEIAFDFRAPAKKGEYTARFQLTANDHTLDGGTLELPVTVTADAPVGYQDPVFTSNRTLINEPAIRVGLYKATDVVQVKSPMPYNIYSGGELKGILPAGESATLDYANGIYTCKSNSLNFNSSSSIRLVPDEISYYFILSNYDRKLSWKGDKNFNAYRGIMEFVYSPKSDAPFVVNELPLDEYVAGIGETSNGAAMEYIKAVLVAARTYAYYQMNNGVSADKRTYDVVATTADQLYLGYNSEVLMPRVVQAEQATYGYMVTYSNTPVITPYFGHSDGRTRNWTEVWGGTQKAWLQSVETTYDAGLSMFGHGVGMSCNDAAHRADEDAWTYEQILHYYYQGTQAEKIY
jgi:hypothetical protein